MLKFCCAIKHALPICEICCKIFQVFLSLVYFILLITALASCARTNKTSYCLLNKLE